MERTLEAAYRNKLAPQWAGRKDRETRSAAALAAYMRRNDARLDEWTRWRDAELEAFRFHADDEQTIREELLDRERVLLDDALAARARDMARRHAAETRWFALVFIERVRLLAEMEDVERESGGDTDIESELRSFYSLPTESGRDDGDGDDDDDDGQRSGSDTFSHS